MHKRHADKLSILFVDNDKAVFTELERKIHPYRKVWNLHFAHGSEEALRIMRNQVFDIVVSDSDIPKVHGMEFLHKVQAAQRRAFRFLLTDHSVQELALQSIPLAHQCFPKPCNPVQIIHAIDLCTPIEGIINNERLREFISNLGGMPSPSETYKKLTLQLESESPSYDQIGALITSDLALTAKILQLVNSAFFGIANNISNIESAMMLLGLDVLKFLVMVNKMTGNHAGKINRCFRIESFSTHAINVANMSKNISRELGLSKDDCELAFTGGLLCDIGKLVFAASSPDKYKQFIQEAVKTKSSLSELEKKRVGATHSEVGTYLLKMWGIPAPILEIIAFHEKPYFSAAKSHTLSPLSSVHIANYLLTSKTIEEKGNPLDWPHLDIEYIKALDLNTEQYSKLHSYGKLDELIPTELI